MSPRPAKDPRVHVAARALAEAMGTPLDWKLFQSEARAVLEAADTVDPLREKAA
ncbi:hypothetical protein [Arthrobacter agilis]|uniref:hypothetical protein n=1 Tax=Arthrobacter agilis TaxID=37921 RepID=UPI00277DEA22|nr:hypothetical protein [Arthrobacter agilis]MDQ0735298.1 hypothetical protein [Arthrobacter agilis]